MTYQDARGTRREARTVTARFRGGRLTPVMATVVKGSEAGMLSQSIMLELDPVAGRLLTPPTGEFIVVGVPVQACDAIKNPTADYAGLTEVVREKLLSGNPLFNLEAENGISSRCGVVPISIGGQKRVNEVVRLAHNAAVNFLRLRKYHKATLLAGTSIAAFTPAIIGQTVLERFNAVLDPDDRINGSVELALAGQAPVQGIYRLNGGLNDVNTSNANVNRSPSGISITNSVGDGMGFDIARPAANNAIVADLDGIYGGNVSLADFYNAEKKDKLTRYLQKMAEENPQYGEEMVLRYAHGLSVDTGKTPILLHYSAQQFGRSIVTANDTSGVQNDIMRSDMMLAMSANMMIPKTELGMVILTFATLKPDETIANQPHPFFTEPWGLDNFVADDLQIDPVPVTIRQLDADCAAGAENTVTMFTGLNEIKRSYVHYGFARHLNPTTVANKTAIWQLAVPLSVTPDTILYPETLSHYPFQDQNAEVCTYTVSSNLTLQSPMIVGPTPVETLSVLSAENIFGDQE